MTSVVFNPTDKKYQVSEDFPPNQTSSWPFPIEKDGWTHAHNSLRNEITQMTASVREANARGPIKAWEPKCIQTFWQTHYAHVEAHHSNEDDIFMPFLQTRVRVPDKVEAQHHELVEMLTKIDGLVKDLKEGAKLDVLLKTLEDYEKLMKPHLAEEEAECLPLMRAYFNPKEIAPKVQEIVSKGPAVEMGSFISTMGMDTFRKEFMPQEGIPSFVWYIDFQFRVNRFIKEFQDPIDAVKMNKAPPPVRGFFASLFSWFF